MIEWDSNNRFYYYDHDPVDHGLIQWYGHSFGKKKIFIEIGAKTGGMSVVSSFYFKYVYSFEENKEDFERMAILVVKNNRHNIKIYHRSNPCLDDFSIDNIGLILINDEENFVEIIFNSLKTLEKSNYPVIIFRKECNSLILQELGYKIVPVNGGIYMLACDFEKKQFQQITTLRQDGKYQEAYDLIKEELLNQDDNYTLLYEMSIVAYFLNKIEEGREASLKIINNPDKVEKSILDQVKSNMKFYIESFMEECVEKVDYSYMSVFDGYYVAKKSCSDFVDDEFVELVSWYHGDYETKKESQLESLGSKIIYFANCGFLEFTNDGTFLNNLPIENVINRESLIPLYHDSEVFLIDMLYPLIIYKVDDGLQNVETNLEIQGECLTNAIEYEDGWLMMIKEQNFYKWLWLSYDFQSYKLSKDLSGQDIDSIWLNGELYGFENGNIWRLNTPKLLLTDN